MPFASNYYSIRANILGSDQDAVSQVAAQAATRFKWGENATTHNVWSYTVFEGDSWGEFDGAMSDALTYAAPMVLKFIIGEESLDKFEEFRSNAESMGLDEARQVAQENIDKMHH